MKHIIYCTLLFLLLSCESKFFLKELEKSSLELILEVDTIAIKIDSSALPEYEVYDSFEAKNQLFYIGFNKHYYTLDLFNLTSKTLEKKITLDNQGPNGIKSVESIFYLNEDSIFIYSRNLLQIINNRGVLVDKVDLLDSFKRKHELVNNYFFKLKYNKANQTFYFYNLYHSRNDISGTEKIVTELNLQTKEFKELPIMSSEFERQNNAQTGYLRWMNFYGFDQESIVYNFQFESNIYTYNVRTGEHNVYGGKTLKFKNSATELNNNSTEDEWNRHAIENTHFFGVLIDPWRKLNYRFNWGDLVFSKNDGSFNSFLDKPLSLTVFDENFLYVQELILPDNLFRVNNWFVNSNGLHIGPTHPKMELDPNYLIFYVYNFKKL